MLVAVCACTCVFATVFAESWAQSNTNAQLESAILAAQNAAEDFTATAASAAPAQTYSAQGLTVRVTVTDSARPAGTMRTATIDVYAQGAQDTQGSQDGEGSEGSVGVNSGTSAVSEAQPSGAAESAGIRDAEGLTGEDAQHTAAPIYTLTTSAYVSEAAK
jgi:hypothetical protein